MAHLGRSVTGLRNRLVLLIALAIMPGLGLLVPTAARDPWYLRHVELLALAGLAVLVIAWYGSEFLVLRPIDRLVKTTGRLAAGDLSARTGLSHGETELGALAAALDRMGAELQALEDLREQAVVKEQRAQAETRTLRDVDRIRKQFINSVSHELRIPLTSILGYAEFLEDGIGGDLTDKQREYVQHIENGAIRLARIVDDLLDYARIEMGSFRLVPEEADAREKTHEIVESLRPQATDARLDLAADLPTEPVVLRADPQRLGQVLTNLIGNAIKFTPKGGKVTVRLLPDQSGARFEVADTGPGIASADLSRLFKPFSQLDNGLRAGGTGLGLSISKALVEAHGGKIGVRSRPGGGSVFWFELPRSGDRQFQGAVSENATATRPLSSSNNYT